MSTARLLRKAAMALDDGDDPFAGSFLRQHDVSFDECMTLAEQMAIGARIVARALEQPRSEAGIAYVLMLAGESTGNPSRGAPPADKVGAS